MNEYIMHFIIYTFAMIGFIVLILFVYKKAVYTPQNSEKKNVLSVETFLKLAPTKTVYILKAGKERFLIAGDSANTTMLAKLEEENYE